MVGKKRNFKERVLAFVLAMLIIATGVFPAAGVTADAAVNNQSEVALAANEEDNVTDESVDENVDTNVTPPPTSGETTEEETPETKTITVKYKIADKSGNVLSNCKVVLKEANSNAEALTGESVDGVYEVKGVKPGALYAFSVEKSGYASKSVNLLYGTESDGNTTTIIIAQEEIQLEETSFKLYAGESKTVNILNAIEFDKNENYNWASNANEVATVENGIITAHSAGSATITVSYGEKSADISVNVSKNSSSIQLDISPNGGKQVNEIKCTVTGLKDDAKGTVEFFVNNVSKGNIEVEKTKEWSYTESEKIKGRISIKAVYSGDARYEASEFTANTNPYTKTADLQLDAKDNKVVFEPELEEKDKTFDIKSILKDVPKDDDRVFTYVSNNEAVAKVDKNGIVSVRGENQVAGIAEITIEAAANDKYEGSKITLTVVVQEKIDVQEIGAEDSAAVWIPYEKVYNGIDVIELKAKLPGQVVGVNEIVATFKATVDPNATGTKENKGTAKDAKVVELISIEGDQGENKEKLDLTECYKLEEIDEDDVAKEIVSITKRTVYLKTVNLNEPIVYRSNVKNVVEKTKNLVMYASAKGDTGLVEKDRYIVDFRDMQATIADSNTFFDVKTHNDVIVPNMEKIRADYQLDNYQFVSVHELSDEEFAELFESTKAEELGDLTICEESLNWENLKSMFSFTSEGGKIYQNNENAEIWIKDGKLMAKIKEEISLYYDKVIFTQGQSHIDLTKDGYDVSNLETGDISGFISLGCSNDTRKGNETNRVNFTIHIDTTAPEVTFGDWKQQHLVQDTMIQTITFNRYKNTYYSIEGVTQTDNKNGSGVKEWYYSVYKTDKDVSPANLEDYINGETPIKWETGSGDVIPVVSDNQGTLEDVQGNYIVLVKVIDNMDNQAVYSSNGVVIEVVAPTVAIDIDDDKCYSSSDIKYKVNVTDPAESTVSGLQKVVVEVFVDGILDEHNSQEIEWLTANSDENKYTLEDIKTSLSEKTESLTLDVNYKNDNNEDICINSNNVVIKATAYDLAGNPSAIAEKTIKIDQTKPEISVHFEDSVDPEHVKYFRGNREMYITYTERNIDTNEDNKGITFDFLAGKGINPKNPIMGLTISDLKNEYGIVVEKVSDSEEGREPNSYTDSREVVYKITFSEDNEYYIAPHCKDLAGYNAENIKYEDEFSKTNKVFVIDKTAPIVKVTYDLTGTDITKVIDDTVSGSRHYEQKQINAKVTIDEQNFALSGNLMPEKDQINFENTLVENAGVATSAEYFSAATFKTHAINSNWGSNGSLHDLTFAFPADANYTFSFDYKDLAGNPCKFEMGESEYVRYFTVDNTAPTGTITIDDKGVWDKLFKAFTFNIFKNSAYEVVVTADDATSGVKYAGYYIARNNSKIDVEDVVWTEYRCTEDGVYTYTIPDMGPEPLDQQFAVYQKIIDNADKTQYIFPTNGAVTENTSQKINLSVKDSVNSKENEIYSGDYVTFNTNFEDPIKDGTFSGIKWVKYVVTANNNGINRNDTYWYDFATGKWVTTETERGDQVQKEEYRTFDKDFQISTSTYNCNNVQVQVFASDFADNPFKSDPVTVDIDITKPRIKSVTFNDVKPQNISYYKDKRIAEIVIEERNFYANGISIYVDNPDKNPATIEWRPGENGVSDTKTHKVIVTFDKDGDYWFSVNGKDLAGNPLSNPLNKSEEFTIDMKDPTFTVSYDNNSEKNGNYYKESRTATITVNEHNFNKNGMTVTVNGTAKSVNWYQAGNDVHKGTVSFATDGDYTFDVECIDLSGRTAANYNEDKFTVDLTSPTVEITGVADKSANKDTVAPAIRIDDTNYSANDVTITLVGAKNGNVDVSSMVSRTATETGQILSFVNFADDMDDVYTLTAKSMDKAGNETTSSITFSVNRHGSTYTINKDTKKMLDKGYTKEPVAVIIEETNVDTLEFVELSYSKDGKIVKLTEGKDYTVKAEGGEGQWKKYTYTILASCFTEEGKYNINITSIDRAQNESNNKVQSFDVEFVVDKTAPTLAVSNLENDGRYEVDKHQFVINVKDNTKLSKVELYIDGKLYYTYKDEELTVEDGKIYIDIDSKDAKQSVKLIAYDEAGNPTEPVEYNVLVTSNWWIQFVANKPAFYGTIAGLVAAAFVIFFIIWKRKKDEEEKAA